MKIVEVLRTHTLRRRKTVWLFLYIFILCCMPLSSWAYTEDTKASFSVEQSTDIVKGNVQDSSNEPLIGASITNQRSKTTVITDINGNFHIKCQIGDEITISFLGCNTEKITIKNFNHLSIMLEDDTKLLDEVVVTGMGISREKKTLGYSSQEVKSKELMRVRHNNVGAALVGKVSGVRFLTPSGSSFSDASVVMRGTNSLSLNRVRGNSPIYVIDGVISDQSAVNMDDVDNLNVLKGPAATALYGSRGGNGAIIITTKRGSAGYQEISVTHTTMFETYYQYAKLQSQYGGGSLAANDGQNGLREYKYQAGPNVNPAYKQMDGALYYNMDSPDQSWGPKFDKNTMYAPWYAWDPMDPRFGEQTPWVSAPQNAVNDGLKTGVTNTTNVAFAKGGEDYLTRISFSNMSRNGVVPNSSMDKRFFSVKTDFKIYKNLTLSADYKYSYRKQHNSGSNGFFEDYVTGSPRDLSLKQLKKTYRRANGTINSYKIEDPAKYGDYVVKSSNPFASMHEVNENTTSNRNLIRGSAEYQIIPKVSVAFIFNGDFYNATAKNKTPKGLYGTKASFAESQEEYRDTQIQGRATYKDAAINNKLRWDANIFIEQRDYSHDQITAKSNGGLIVDKLYNFAGSVDKATASNSSTKLQEKSLFGTGTVSWDDTYFAEVTMRNDWSSTLPQDKRSYLYGGASASYIASNHIKLPWLSFLKLRASLAQVGSAMNPYQALDNYSIGKYGDLTVMSQPTSFIDKGLKPTISTSYEAGLEFNIFNGRLSGDFNLYLRNSKNQIIHLPTSHQSGYGSILTNAGLIRNKGFELSLSALLLKTKDISWSLGFNISKNTNKLVELSSDKSMTVFQQNYASYGDTFVVQWAEVGEPIGVIRGTDFERANGKVILTKRVQGSNQSAAEFQEMIDTSGEYEIQLNRSEKNYLGNSQPKAMGGVSSSFEFKNFVLSATMDFQIGGKIASGTNMFGNANGMLKSTVGKNSKGTDIRNKYSDGGGVDFHGVIQNGVDASGNPTYSDVTTRVGTYYYNNMKRQVWGPNIHSASYVKLRELSLSYKVPRSFTKNILKEIKDINLSFVATNPWLIYSGTKNIDVSDTAGGGGSGFFDSGNIIPTRSFGFTVNLTF